jgi:hypothetical protein
MFFISQVFANFVCHNPSLEFASRSVRRCEGMNPHTPREFHFGSSTRTPESSEGDYRGQNLMDWGGLYINEKILEFRYLKWVRITHLDIWNTSYGQKKGRESNWQFDSRPLKVGNRLDFHVCRWCATYRWKALDKGYNFALNLISIRSLHAKLWRPKVAGVPTLTISGFSFGSPETKNHLEVQSIL